MDATLDIAGYRKLMGIFHGFYARHDQMLADACGRFRDDLSGYTYAARTDILSHDLLNLGADKLPIADPPPGGELPSILSPTELAGMLYVFEGSMLGGATMCQAAQTLLAKQAAKGNGYWQWCRDAGATRWAMTCGMLENLAENDSDREDMIDGARAAFMVFGNWLATWHDAAKLEDVHLRSPERC